MKRSNPKTAGQKLSAAVGIIVAVGIVFIATLWTVASIQLTEKVLAVLALLVVMTMGTLSVVYRIAFRSKLQLGKEDELQAVVETGSEQ